MINVLELVAILTLALVLAQGVAWASQWTSFRRESTWVDTKMGGQREGRALWGETTKAHFHYVRRRTRYQVHCPVAYQVDGHAVEGIVVDMSREGWRIKSTDIVPVGTVMSLSIFLPGNDLPVPVSCAIVRWSHSGEFGISLVALDARPTAQISEFFSTLTPMHSSGIASA